MISESDNSARARLVKTRRGTWIDESLLPEARRECLGVLREAARKAVGKTTYLPSWISDATDSVEDELEELSIKRLKWKPTPAEQEMEEEVDATMDALEERGAFEGLGLWERLEFWLHVSERIRLKYESQIAREADEARKKKRWPKSNPTLITEKDILNSTLNELHRHGVLNKIMVTHFMRAPVEEDDAQSLARKARETARWCGCCGQKLSYEKPAYFGAKVYVGMWPIFWDRVSKPQLCKPDYQRTVLCDACAPEWLAPDRDDVVTQLCAHCERPMVERLKLSSLQRTFCSGLCQQEYHNQLRKEKRAEARKKVCEECGKEFTATRRDAKTCPGGVCRQKAYRRRKREAQQDQ